MRSLYDPFTSAHFGFPFDRRSRRDPPRATPRREEPRRDEPPHEVARRIPVAPRRIEPPPLAPAPPPVSSVPHDGEDSHATSHPPRQPASSAVESAGAAPAVSLESELQELARVRERLTRESEREVERRERAVLVSFLDVVDDLERAITSAKAVGPADRSLMQGVEMVHTRFLDKLAAYGVERQGAVGDTFDPSAHEAIAITPVDDPALGGRVTNVVRPGYRIAGELLRPATVVVGKS